MTVGPRDLSQSWKKDLWQNGSNSQNENCHLKKKSFCEIAQLYQRLSYHSIVSQQKISHTIQKSTEVIYVEQMKTTLLETWQLTKPFLSAGVNVNFSETMFVCLFLSRMSVFYTACWSIWSNFGCQMTKSARCTAIALTIYLFSTYVADAIRQWANHKTYTRYTICCLHSGCLTLKQFHV